MNQTFQKEYFIDGIPASKFGEWPGIYPNKWKGSIKTFEQIGNIFNSKF